MSDYNRTTRECPISQLHPELRQAIHSYFQAHELGDLEAKTLMCCETVSERKDFGKLAFLPKDSSDTTIHTGMLLTSELLIWVRRGDQTGIVLNAADLKEIQVRATKSILANDSGLEIFGYIVNSKSRVNGFVGMGEGSAAEKFCDEVNKAISIANPPVKTIWPKWLGG